MDDPSKNERLRALPSIDELLVRPSLQAAYRQHPHAVVVGALRAAVASARARLLLGEPEGFDEAEVEHALARASLPALRRVLNATGVVLHTNLGRAPLHARALARILETSRGYTNLEFDLDSGERGRRDAKVTALLCALTGAEDALVVNNCAAAVLLTLGAFASGREAIVSRGELVEIGGGFRIPDVMRQSHAALVEVGTTNRTRLADYAAAFTPQTGLLVKVHQSNFAVVGFTEAAGVRELSGLAREKGARLFVDLGSGALGPLHGEGIPAEPTVSSVVQAGADVVAFSGDKLLGGPQAGLIVGRADALAALKQHPLNRALRVDKLTLAALEATLELYRDGLEAELPARRLLAQPKAALESRARALAGLLEARAVPTAVVAAEGRVGGGCLPLAKLPSFACTLLPPSGAQALHDRLRRSEPPVVGRLSDGALLLDVRCLEESDLEAVARAVAAGWNEA